MDLLVFQKESYTHVCAVIKIMQKNEYFLTKSIHPVMKQYIPRQVSHFLGDMVHLQTRIRSSFKTSCNVK